jgi:two-component system response regulator AtoC
MAYRWTGNVRELKNLIERAALIGKGPELRVKDLGIGELGRDEAKFRQSKIRDPESKTPFPPIPPAGIDLNSVQKSLEKFYIGEAYKMAGGNESKAARFLNMNHHTFRYRRKKLQI